MDAGQHPTPEQLMRAWQERRRPDWPATFEAVMAHAIYGRVVRIHAAHGQRPAPVTRRPPVLAPEPPPIGRPWRPPPKHVQDQMYDPRRAASGERDDD